MKILFMGTPDFALFSLRALAEGGDSLVGVVTQPDKPKGRGYTLTPPPVKVFAMEHGIPVFQPNTLRDGSFDATLRELDPELIVVTAYGKILPASVLDYPKYGCINVHGSLLPEYRGAAPMQRAIIDGKGVTGVTIMQMDVGMDTGDMLLRREVEIGENDNFEDVHDALGVAGAEALMETIEMIKAGTVRPEKQDESLASYAKKIEKADCVLDFTRPARELHDRIRGLSPFPLAFTHLPGGAMLKVTRAEVAERESIEAKLRECGLCAAACGAVVLLDEGIVVATGDGYLRILGVLPEGKGRMNAADFIRGRKIAVGDALK